MINQPADIETLFWHRELPPLDAVPMGDHTVEANSSRISGSMVHREELWNLCYEELMANARGRLLEEVKRLGGQYAHVYEEAIAPKRDDAAGETWLHGTFTYTLYGRNGGDAGT